MGRDPLGRTSGGQRFTKDKYDPLGLPPAQRAHQLPGRTEATVRSARATRRGARISPALVKAVGLRSVVSFLTASAQTDEGIMTPCVRSSCWLCRVGAVAFSAHCRIL